MSSLLFLYGQNMLKPIQALTAVSALGTFALANPDYNFLISPTAYLFVAVFLLSILLVPSFWIGRCFNINSFIAFAIPFIIIDIFYLLFTYVEAGDTTDEQGNQTSSSRPITLGFIIMLLLLMVFGVFRQLRGKCK